MPSKLQSYKVVCQGGLNSNENYLDLSQNYPGSGTTLLNFEPSLYGGYRRINGFAPLETNYPDVDDTLAEGQILGVFIYNQGIQAARKLKSGATYNFYFWTSGADWTGYTTGLTLVSTGVEKIRYATFNFDGTETVIFTDGVNNATIFNGTNWGDVDPSGTGVDLANAGGDQALTNPKFCTTFKNHVFVSGDSADPHIVAHSAPNDHLLWTAAGGGGQINAGFIIKQIKPFRDELYVFGETKIKKIVVDGTDFVLKDVAGNVGCLAPDSVVEINGDLLFLAQDGFRTIAGTAKIGDVELGVMSKDIQVDVTDLILNGDLNVLNSVVIRRKSQVRFFFSDENVDTSGNVGVIGGLRGNQNGISWEWSRLRGIRTSVATSGYIGPQEYILHGDFNGKVYRQESGNSFDGSNVIASYTMPYNDFGDCHIRKNIHKITLFLRPEGEVLLNTALQFDWGRENVINPTSYLMEGEITGALYGTAVYGIDRYARGVLPVLYQNVSGSGFSARITFTSNDMNAPYSLQGIVFEYAVNGRN